MIDAPTRDRAATVQLAQLLFRIFIYVTDTDKEVTPYEVQRFNRLIEDPRWTHSEQLRGALEQVREDYTSLWTEYEAKTLGVELESISRDLESAWFKQGGTGGELRQSLRDFVQKIGQTGSPALARLGIVGAAVSKTAARARIEGLLALDGGHGGAGGTSLPAPEPAPATAASSLWPASSLAFADPHLWRGGRTRVRCANVTAETADVKTYSFAAVPERIFYYKPGQFLTIELQIDGKTVRRSYTISSSPTRPHLLTITVKRVPGGLVSNWLYENMVEGAECYVSGPAGDFTCLNHPAPKLLLLSGGSGVTPMMSMLRWLSDTMSQADVVFINNVRTPADIIFERELQIISARLGSMLTLAVVPGLLTSGQSWNGLAGPLGDHMLQTFAPDFLEREVFVCGPAGYMDMVQNMLQQLGFPMTHFHQESFVMGPGPAGVAPTPPHAPPVSVAIKTSPPVAKPVAAPELSVPAPRRKAGAAPSVVFGNTGQVISCSPEETILDAAERHGIALPSLCRSGLCGTCRVRRTTGKITMDDQKALAATDIDEGWVLACVAHAHDRVVLEV